MTNTKNYSEVETLRKAGASVQEALKKAGVTHGGYYAWKRKNSAVGTLRARKNTGLNKKTDESTRVLGAVERILTTRTWPAEDRITTALLLMGK